MQIKVKCNQEENKKEEEEKHEKKKFLFFYYSEANIKDAVSLKLNKSC